MFVLRIFTREIIEESSRPPLSSAGPESTHRAALEAGCLLSELDFN